MKEQEYREPLVKLRDAVGRELAVKRQQAAELKKDVEQLEIAMRKVDSLIEGWEVAYRFNSGSLAGRSAIDALVGMSLYGVSSPTDEPIPFTDRQGEEGVEYGTTHLSPSVATNETRTSSSSAIEARSQAAPNGPSGLNKPDIGASQKALATYVLDVDRLERGHDASWAGLLPREVTEKIKEHFGVEWKSRAAAKVLSKLAKDEPDSNVKNNGGRYRREA